MLLRIGIYIVLITVVIFLFVLFKVVPELLYVVAIGAYMLEKLYQGYKIVFKAA